MRVTAVQEHDAWLEDYVQDILREEPAPLPASAQRIGKTIVKWWECTPGVAFIDARGGTTTDRLFASNLVNAQLSPHGFKRAAYTYVWDKSDEKLIKEAGWTDIEEGAKRLIQGNKVHILRNGANVVAANVEGDHGNYESKAWREDPNSQAITMWECTCPWDQFAWQRTRQWKKYEGRMCKHVLAMLWQAQATPLDEDVEPEPSPQGPTPSGGPPGALGPGSPGVGEPQGFEPAMQPQQGAPGTQAPAPPGQLPEEQNMLMPPYSYGPQNMPAVNPVSVPGGKEQNAMNPIQNQGAPPYGGTFSKVAFPHWHISPRENRESIEQEGLKQSDVDNTHVWMFDDQQLARAMAPKGWGGRGPVDIWEINTDDIPLHPDPHIGWSPPKMMQHSWVAKQPIPPELLRRRAKMQAMAANDYVNGDMVSNNKPEIGVAVGLGAGESVEIPANSVGEVLGTDPTTGMVNVYFAGPMGQRGNLEPHGVQAWFFPGELRARPDIRRPGPAIRRNR